MRTKIETKIETKTDTKAGNIAKIRINNKSLMAKLVALLMLFAMMPFAGPGAFEAYAAEGSGGPEIATWSGFRKCAVSFTFDDGAPSHISDAAPLFEKYGYRASFYLVCNWNPNWSGFQSLADNGHEVGSHSNTHGQNMSGEEASSKTNIQGKIIQKYGCITVAYPNSNVPNESSVLQNYIAGRIYNGTWAGMSSDTMGKDGPTNWAKVPAMMTGAQGTIKTTDDFTEQMQTVKLSNGWAVFVTHGFNGKNNGNATYSPTDINAIEGALKWANQNDSDIWVAPLRDVAMYIKERKASTVKLTASSASSMTITLTHSIKDDVSNYDYPLSVRVPMPSGWSSAEVAQASVDLEEKIDGGWLYFDAVPNGGDIVVTRKGDFVPVSIDGAEVVLSAGTFTYNGKVRKPSIKSVTTAGGEKLAEGTDYTVEWQNGSSTNAGSYGVTVTGKGAYTGTATARYTINKAANPLKLKPKTAALKAKKLKKKAQILEAKKLMTASGQGKLTYKLVSVKKTKFKKYFKVDAKTGKVTVKKKLKKGKYKLKINVTAAGNSNYNKVTKPVTVTINVK